MTLEQLLGALEKLETAVTILADAGISVLDAVEAIQTARREGRALTAEELQAFADRAIAAVDRL